MKNPLNLTDHEITDTTRLENARAYTAILDELGEPFPLIDECLAEGQTPAQLEKTTRHALADCIDYAILRNLDDIERHPEKYAGTAEQAWANLFDGAPDGEFKWEDPGCGDWIPSRDGDDWVQYAYSIDLGRRANGIEWVEFKQTDLDGNWEMESEHQRSVAGEITGPEEFVQAVATSTCYWSCLRMEAYAAWCVLHGEDPLHIVNPLQKTLKAAYRFDLHRDGTCSNTSLGFENAAMAEQAQAYLFGKDLKREFGDLLRIMRGNPEGKDLKEDRYGNPTYGYRPVTVTEDHICIDVDMVKKVDHTSPEHIRQVMMRTLWKDVAQSVAGLAKLAEENGYVALLGEAKKRSISEYVDAHGEPFTIEVIGYNVGEGAIRDGVVIIIKCQSFAKEIGVPCVLLDTPERLREHGFDGEEGEYGWYTKEEFIHYDDDLDIVVRLLPDCPIDDEDPLGTIQVFGCTFLDPAEKSGEGAAEPGEGESTEPDVEIATVDGIEMATFDDDEEGQVILTRVKATSVEGKEIDLKFSFSNWGAALGFVNEFKPHLGGMSQFLGEGSGKLGEGVLNDFGSGEEETFRWDIDQGDLLTLDNGIQRLQIACQSGEWRAQKVIGDGEPHPVAPIVPQKD